MKAVYSIEVKLCATAYITAESEEEAQQIADGLTHGIELPTGYCGDGVEISGRSYQNLEEQVALSPAMTLYGAFEEGDKVEHVEDITEEDEDEEEA